MSKQILRSQIRQRRRSGAMVTLISVLLPVIAICAAYSVNVAYMELAETELRIATDTAARAGGRELALTGDVQRAKVAARAAAGRNKVAGEPLQLADGDITFGISRVDSHDHKIQFTPNLTTPNSVVVTGRRTGDSTSGPIRLYLPKILGIGEFQSVQQARSTRLELDIALVLDRSGSMAYAADEVVNPAKPPLNACRGWQFGDPAPSNSRWLDLVAATQSFLREQAAAPLSVRVALCTYGDRAWNDVPLTSTNDDILTAMHDYTNVFDGGGTNTGEGIDFGVQSLFDTTSRGGVGRVIILMTDGRHNTGTDPIAAAEVASQFGVRIFTISFTDDADQETMRDVAQLTGGQHYYAPTAEDLPEVFRQIVKSLPTLLLR